MNIYIKSFNRPYYLDRCISSIINNVIDKDLRIIVLDDGTDAKYLKKIQEKYPLIIICLSNFYYEKLNKINNFLINKEPVGSLEIPTKFWLSHITSCKDEYMMVLEDDMWFTSPIIVKESLGLMKKHNMCILKMCYFRNKKLIAGELSAISDLVNRIEPKLISTNPFLFENLIVKNRLKIMSILMRFGLYNYGRKIEYYTIYNVAGAIYSKSYYDYLWEDFAGHVDEDQQLIRAVKFMKDKSPNYGVFKNDVINTSFSSSATNMFSDIHFNVFEYNNILNEAWFQDNFDVWSNFPNDISEEQIKNILEKTDNTSANVVEWEKWMHRFKANYISVGHQIT
ncbi:glycosyltransferase family A protein [Flavobacterium sp. GT2N3]|uniref:glycosyltransferase family A protein n=1 Tax=unclassified Flavobacterium TaxID=196869 RepID=UPI003AB002DB